MWELGFQSESLLIHHLVLLGGGAEGGGGNLLHFGGSLDPSVIQQNQRSLS